VNIPIALHHHGGQFENSNLYLCDFEKMVLIQNGEVERVHIALCAVRDHLLLTLVLKVP
jgi:hypothetical protein